MPKVRERKILASSTEKKLAAYTLAASSGLAAVAVPAQGAIVYTSAKEFGEAQPGATSTVFIDLNHDGINDFELLGSGYHLQSSVFNIFSAKVFGGAFNSNAVAVQTAPTSPFLRGNGTALSRQKPMPDHLCCFGSFAKALNFGQEIGPGLTFGFGGYLGYQYVVGSSSINTGGAGPFYNEKNKFIGLELVKDGKTYYGWARVSTKGKGPDLYFELVDYAYQNTPGVPILAGQGIPKSGTASLDSEPSSFASHALTGRPDESPRLPATIGLLAYGADALSAWRGK